MYLYNSMTDPKAILSFRHIALVVGSLDTHTHRPP